MSSLAGVHGQLGLAALPLFVVLAVAAVVVTAVGARPAAARLGRVVDLLWVVALGAAVLAFVLGPLVLLGGALPRDTIHVAYGVAAVLVLPVLTGIGAWRSARGGFGPTRYAWVAAGAAISAVIALLLAQTG